LVTSGKNQPPPVAMLRQAGGLLRGGRPDQALELLQPLRAAHPANSDVLRMVGIALVMLGRLEDAEAALRERFQAHPEQAAARSDLANVLLSQNRPHDALELLEPLARQKLDGAARFNLARALKGVGRAQQAAEWFEELLRLQPGHSGALISLGDCYKALGRAGDAATLFRRAIDRQERDGVAWWSLSNLKAGSFSPGEMERLESLVRQARPPDQQVYFEFALATGLEQHGETARAFAHYQQGNQLKHRLEPWDRMAFATWLDQLRAAFAESPAPSRPDPLGSPRPVFIVSLPRSGSTLTEQILAAHPEVTAASELPWMPRIVGEESAARGRGIVDWAPQASEDDWLRVGARYMDRSRDWQQGATVFTDKLPGNFPYTPAILRMLPDALVVNVTRNAMDVCWSCYRQLFISGSEFAYDLEDLAAYWLAHHDYMTYWAGREPGRVLNLSYEELVRQPEQQARRLLEFVGLPWNESCLRFYETDRAVNTASASQVRQRINTRGLGHWQRYRQELKPLVSALEAGGYDVGSIE
jgi:tetratricopeptide (TPR) repeat protein